MSNDEFSDEFDVLYNSITSNQAPGLNEYEKSVFLTKAQYDVLKNYFDPKGNKFQEGFDGSKKRQADFTNLIRTKVLEELNINNDLKFDRRSRCYSMPNDLFLPINEKCNNDTSNYVVSAISFIEYDALMLKPYQYPIKRQVWRLFTDKQAPVTVTTISTIDGVNYIYTFTNSSNKKVTFKLNAVLSEEERGPIINETINNIEIICNIPKETPTSAYWSKYKMANNENLMPYLGDLCGGKFSRFPNFVVPDGYKITIDIEPSTFIIELIGRVPEDIKYTMRYLIKPKPIVLTNLEGVSIEGVSVKTECELDPQLHPEVLQRAVELADAVYKGDLNSQIALGQTSQTNMGVVQTSR